MQSLLPSSASGHSLTSSRPDPDLNDFLGRGRTRNRDRGTSSRPRSPVAISYTAAGRRRTMQRCRGLLNWCEGAAEKWFGTALSLSCLCVNVMTLFQTTQLSEQCAMQRAGIAREAHAITAQAVRSGAISADGRSLNALVAECTPALEGSFGNHVGHGGSSGLLGTPVPSSSGSGPSLSRKLGPRR